jgi:hypothetical protein
MKHVQGRIVVKADKDGKNWHTFSDGKKIRLEREYDNLDRKHTSQVLGEVVSGEYVPSGAMILFHHNSMHPVNQIFNHSELNGEELASGVQVYSIPETECYLWKMPGEKDWKPLKGFATALRVFKPYDGFIEGVLPEKMNNILYITSGKLKGKVCHTLKASDLSIIFNNEQGVEETIVRVRHFEGEDLHEREEIIAIDNALTKMVKAGKLLVGIDHNHCEKVASSR